MDEFMNIGGKTFWVRRFRSGQVEYVRITDTHHTQVIVRVDCGTISLIHMGYNYHLEMRDLAAAFEVATLDVMPDNVATMCAALC